MARYAIGDIQGCFNQLSRLLSQINFNKSKDTLYLVGDLVNRGSQSLEVLRWARDNQDNVISVLGNHDIYMLARYLKLQKPHSDDTLQDLLRADDVDDLMMWVRNCPLIHEEKDYIIVHAGIYPKVDFNHLLFLNHLFCEHLMSKNISEFVDSIYGNKPNNWTQDLTTEKQIKFLVNSCTRMRYLNNKNYELDYSFKGNLNKKPDDLTPWFDVDFHATINKKIIFGHWASLGLFENKKCIGIDTGCIWGYKLTAFNMDTFELIQVL